MGRPKALLPFGGETLLQRVLRILGDVVATRIVVAAEGQTLPPLPDDVLVTFDAIPDRGPLEGIQAGLRAGRDLADSFYISSCDVPLLQSQLVSYLFSLLAEDVDIVVPRDDKHFHPLAAVYRTTVLPTVEQLLAADRRRPFFLFEQCETLVISADQLRSVDPDLNSLRNINTPSDYALALKDR